MGELMNNRGVNMAAMSAGTGFPHTHGMMPHNFAAIPANLSPSSSVLMTPKSANTPPGTHMFQTKPPFVLHHPNSNPSTMHGYNPSQWSAGQNQFVFPSPTTMSFSNPSLSASSPICSTVMTPHW